MSKLFKDGDGEQMELPFSRRVHKCSSCGVKIRAGISKCGKCTKRLTEDLTRQVKTR